MCAEVYRPYLQGGDKQGVSVEARKMDQDVLLERVAQVEKGFREKYNWDEELIRELFERVAGSQEEVSGELQRKFRELYLEGRSNPFLVDEKRTVYKTIFEAFTGNFAQIDEIKETITAQKGTPRNVDELYVVQHLLLAIEKVSVHHE